MVLSIARLRRNADVFSREIIASSNKLVIMIGLSHLTLAVWKTSVDLQCSRRLFIFNCADWSLSQISLAYSPAVPCPLPSPTYSTTANKLKKPSWLPFLLFFFGGKSMHFSRPCLSFLGETPGYVRPSGVPGSPSNFRRNLDKWQGKVALLLGSYLWLCSPGVGKRLQTLFSA